MMRTNIVLDDHLMDEAFQYAGDIRTKRELIETALREFVKNKRMKNLRDLKGKIIFAENYDYKKMRAGK
jgi:Arc/MetJ family transcription regulator